MPDPIGDDKGANRTSRYKPPFFIQNNRATALGS